MARLPRLPAAAAFAVAVLLSAAALPAARAASPAADDAPEYRNHTVGGADGWFFDARTNATSGNYSGWANGETFYLGDYLSTSSFSPFLPALPPLQSIYCRFDWLGTTLLLNLSFFSVHCDLFSLYSLVSTEYYSHALDSLKLAMCHGGNEG